MNEEKNVSDFFYEKQEFIKKQSYDKNRQIVMISIWNNAWELVVELYSQGRIKEEEILPTFRSWAKKLCQDWWEWQEEFNNDYFRRLRERIQRNQ